MCDTTTNKCVQCSDQRGLPSGHAHLHDKHLHSLHRCQPLRCQEPHHPGMRPERHQCWAVRGVHGQQHLLGTTPVCDTTTTNKCVQCLLSATCAAGTPICANEYLHGLHGIEPVRQEEQHDDCLCCERSQHRLVRSVCRKHGLRRDHACVRHHDEQVRAVHGQQHLLGHHAHLLHIDEYLPRLHGR